MQTKIKAILFDADGVIIDAYMAFSVVLDNKYGLPLEKTKDFFKGPFVDCLEGRLDMRDVLPEFLERWQWHGSLDDFLNLWFTTEHSIEQEIIDDVERLRGNGILCYIATDQEKHRANYMMEDMGFKDHFDGRFASSDLGVRKINADFFQKILNRLELRPEQVLFWDDSSDNLEAAHKLNLNAELFTSVNNYKEIMNKKYGL